MARLPTPGGDDGAWGGVLNDFLNQAHNTDGSIKTAAVAAAGGEQTANKGAAGGYAPLDGTGKVPAANLPPAGTTPDADAVTKGVIQLAGDLSGTATSPQIAAGVILDVDVNAGAAIAQSKIANLTTDLGNKADAVDLSNHISDATAAHAASAISVTPVGAVAATDVQAAIAELDTDKSATSHTHTAADVGAVKATDGGEETVQNHGNSGAAATVDLVNGNNHSFTLDANCTFTFTGATNGVGCSFTLILTQDGVGSKTVTWPASVKWSQATPPTLSTTASAIDILTFMTVDGGVTWYGFFAGKGMA
jgi:hypothetical protein